MDFCFSMENGVLNIRKKYLIYIAILSVSVSAICGCRPLESVNERLDRAENCMNSDPELALRTIDSIDTGMLSTKSQHARYALLYSIALDKNYIDETNDSVINIAVKYYRHHGTAEEKLKSYYYLGRVYQNAGERQLSMESFVEAEKYADKSGDFVAEGMLYRAKSAVYKSIYDIENALKESYKAAECYSKGGDYYKYGNVICDIIGYSLMLEKIDDIEKYLGVLKENWDKLHDRQKSAYYSYMLQLYDLKGNDADDCVKLTDRYLSEIQDSSIINWATLADMYQSKGMILRAKDAIACYREFDSTYVNEAIYYWLYAIISEKEGAFEEAMKAYKEYVFIRDEDDIDIYESDTKFIEERHSTKIRLSYQQQMIIILVLGILVLILTSILVFFKIRSVMLKKQEEKMKLESDMEILKTEKERYQKRYDNALKETERLKRLIENSKLDSNVRLCVEERLNVLNKFIHANISKSFSRSAADELKELMSDKKRFLDSTKMSFMVSHPNLMSFLAKHGLNDFEIGCCCLYCIGFNGKEIMTYLDRNSFYNFSSAIRKKLGIKTHETNLDIFLQEKMAGLD